MGHTHSFSYFHKALLQLNGVIGPVQSAVRLYGSYHVHEALGLRRKSNCVEFGIARGKPIEDAMKKPDCRITVFIVPVCHKHQHDIKSRGIVFEQATSFLK
jgi:hypothetical protein